MTRTRNWPDVILGWQAGSLEADGLVITHCLWSQSAWFPALIFSAELGRVIWSLCPGFPSVWQGEQHHLAGVLEKAEGPCAYSPLGVEGCTRKALVLGLLFTGSCMCVGDGEKRAESLLLSRVFWLYLNVPRVCWLRGRSWPFRLLCHWRNKPGSSTLAAVVNLQVYCFFSQW